MGSHKSRFCSASFLRASGSRNHAGERLALAALAAVALASAALGQGAIDLDNSQCAGGLTIDCQGNYYSGIYGVEIWELNATAVPTNLPASGFAFDQYNALAALGFKLEATFSNRNNPLFPGSIILGEVDMPDVSLPGATVVLALAAWNTSAASWNAMLTSSDANTRAGVVVFVNRTSNYTLSPVPPPPLLTGWTTDLVLGFGQGPYGPCISDNKLSITATNGTVTLHWIDMAYTSYSLLTATNLLGPWSWVHSFMHGTPDTNFTYVAPASDRVRFYRVTPP